MWFLKKKIENSFKPISLDQAKRKAKIILIDDEDTFPIEMFDREGYSIKHWKKVESLGPLEKGDYDIIVLDIAGVAKDYSEDDGIGILTTVKEQNPSQIIIAYSGQTFDISKVRFFNKADSFLPKPSDFLTCKAQIDELLLNKFNPLHYWKGIETLLEKQGLTKAQIAKLESRVVEMAIKNEGSINLESDLSGFLFKSDDLLRVAELMAKVGGLLWEMHK